MGRMMVHLYLWLYYLCIIVANLVGIGLLFYALPFILRFIIVGDFFESSTG